MGYMEDDWPTQGASQANPAQAPTQSTPTQGNPTQGYPGQGNAAGNAAPSPASLVNSTVYLTDARWVGVMLRDKRLTLRNHAALTRTLVEGEGDKVVLRMQDVSGDNNYVKVGDKNTFKAEASRKDAQKFEIKNSKYGLELFLDGERPGCHDDYFDVSVGKWKDGGSHIPILLHSSDPQLWLTRY